MSNMSKVMSLEGAAGLVNDGDVVALQNMATQAAPMAMVRELIRQQKRNLGLVCLVGGMPVDWLAAAGVIDRFIGAAVSMETFGLCQQYRKAVEEHGIDYRTLKAMARNSITFSFADEATRARLRAELDAAFRAFDARYVTRSRT